ncbi:NAD(P)-dependent alcohol dehydrogenase [Robiginitalea aurantiaca]|uniref:NAD(P)-dependent alcohol dehydrogenase n=1 Tax=Robiginitalea aurantiaca TaxID=3056915 RepID=A0ABT7WFM9_9FLAO|nr:NAD(P)-dependent alcohol dehydrogenase [Robiginitalea aurantiaca]MDM9631726.1 NAD(P)-dependent alcohol dehydrogenase [Robiginitalea aurantiaca]
MMSTTVSAFGTQSAEGRLDKMNINRRNPGKRDVYIEITYCGVCHSDIHTARNEWLNSTYPVVPGHEIVGRVLEVGSKVRRFKAGDLVGVGCMVDSCKECAPCKKDLEQFCEKGCTWTYNSPEPDFGRTYGGYSTHITVDQDFVLKIPETIDVRGAAPLLCAGITTWSPLRHWKVGKKDRVGVVGLGGLGHMGIKFANALGAHVVMITRSPEKARDAEALGAHEVLISTDSKAMQAQANSFDFILNTIPVGHEMDPYIGLLKIDATMVLVGAVEPLKPFHGGGVMMGRKRIAGSLIGGIAETQEMLDFCGKHNITCDVEMIDMQEINEAYERVVASDVKYRFVIDMQSLKSQ